MTSSAVASGYAMVGSIAFVIVGTVSLIAGSALMPAVGHGYLALMAAWLVTVLLTEVRRKS